MNSAHIRAVLEGVVPEQKAWTAQQMAPLAERIAELEKRELVKGDKGDPGEPGRDGIDGSAGKDADPELIERLVSEAVAKIPAPLDGKDGTPGTPGQDGKSVTVDDVRPVLEEMVAALPKPVDGKDPDPSVVRLMVAEEVAKIPPASDGKDGRDADPALIERLVKEAVGNIPTPRNGKDGEPGAPGIPGRDGRDASDLGVIKEFIREQFRAEFAEVLKTVSFSTPDFGRTLVLEIAEQKRQVVTAIPLAAEDDLLWREGVSYRKGDMVKWGGSGFIAKCDTTTKPSESDVLKSDWRLFIKRGRDGKDGKGEKGEPGPKGERGETGPRAYGG